VTLLRTAKAVGQVAAQGEHAQNFVRATVASPVNGFAAPLGQAEQIINPDRARMKDVPAVVAQPYFGSAGVEDPDGDNIGDGRLNRDRYANFKAQSWMHLRRRIERTHLAVTQGLAVDRDEIFSIRPGLPELEDLFSELTQIRYGRNGSGKIVIEKTPDGFVSPDRADAVLIAFAPIDSALEVWRRLG
jgi:phage terminase large subunit